MTGRKNLHVWAGECHVHAGINGDELADQARAHPDAELFVHPGVVAQPRRYTSPAKEHSQPSG